MFPCTAGVGACPVALRPIGKGDEVAVPERVWNTYPWSVLEPDGVSFSVEEVLRYTQYGEAKSISRPRRSSCPV